MLCILRCLLIEEIQVLKSVKYRHNQHLLIAYSSHTVFSTYVTLCYVVMTVPKLNCHSPPPAHARISNKWLTLIFI